MVLLSKGMGQLLPSSSYTLCGHSNRGGGARGVPAHGPGRVHGGCNQRSGRGKHGGHHTRTKGRGQHQLQHRLRPLAFSWNKKCLYILSTKNVQIEIVSIPLNDSSFCRCSFSSFFRCCFSSSFWSSCISFNRGLHNRLYDSWCFYSS